MTAHEQAVNLADDQNWQLRIRIAREMQKRRLARNAERERHRLEQKWLG